MEQVPALGNQQATRILKRALQLSDAVAEENALGFCQRDSAGQ